MSEEIYSTPQEEPQVFQSRAYAKTVYIAVTTFDRPEHFERLMKSLKEEMKPGYRYILRVYDDASPADYALNSPGFEDIECVKSSFRFTKNNGKKGYWRVIDRVMQDAGSMSFDYFFLIQDDCVLVPDFFAKAISDWNEIEDANKGSYCTFTPRTIYNRLMWESSKAKDVVFNGKKFISTGYVDCIFMVPRSTLELLEFTIQPISADLWKVNPNYSSGVGKQLSGRLRSMGKTMYGAWSSLVITSESSSKMNPRERMRNPLESLIRDENERAVVRVPSKIEAIAREQRVCGIATIPSRELLLKQTLLSLVPQMDEINVVLNGYSKPPVFVNDAEFKNVKFHMDDGKRGDANKFKFVDQAKGFYFSCDDDIIYPPDYADKMIEKLNQYHRKVLVTCHGRIVPARKIKRFYKETRQHHFVFSQKDDLPVHIPGTGVSAFHTSAMKVTFNDFKTPNMADIWMGVLAKKNNVPCICIERKQRWLRALKAPEAIFDANKFTDDFQVEVVNSVEWN